ncbi:5'-methylthioadenosine/adenosylhomocysteine nucleosidase [Priestia taiwanensis]|uniref:adenosylhomocysteine nucleosidase n=1 Tax=Priestia taiwanensis TaxID=1347902 RepID=A0A917ALM6_9BACI|nr:5'-methylthioadenosine/adenosylhomocysteine nucleosidase [Priestia taiwanensis]MBM7361849.1 adenosylhomocysteine nucleosidase [Priestia taiwanensis]GGE57409.1 5'-methylthioadenosine/S-adenosylhomocysteine nucleosidase [Priestia taiwanensis]
MIGIIGAMQIEIEKIKQHMTITSKARIAGFSFYRGCIGDTEVVLTKCSVGKVNAAACTQLLINKYDVTCIINTGIAGGMHESLNLGDVVISTDVTYHDVRQIQMKNFSPFQESFFANERLIEVAEASCKQVGVTSHTGRIVTGDSFVSDDEQKRQLVETYEPYAVEMEGAAIGHIAYMNKCPFVVIRSISDLANGQATVDYEQFKEIAANHSASIVVKMTEQLMMTRELKYEY